MEQSGLPQLFVGRVRAARIRRRGCMGPCSRANGTALLRVGARWLSYPGAHAAGLLLAGGGPGELSWFPLRKARTPPAPRHAPSLGTTDKKRNRQRLYGLARVLCGGPVGSEPEVVWPPWWRNAQLDPWERRPGGVWQWPTGQQARGSRVLCAERQVPRP